MLKYKLNLFFVLLFTFQFAMATQKMPNASQLKQIEAARTEMSLSILMAQYQAIQKPEQIATVLLSHLSQKEITGAEKAFKGTNRLPKIQRNGRVLTILDGKDQATIEVVDSLEGKFKINGLNYTFDPSLSFNENVRYIQERYFGKGYSGIFRLLIPQAYAMGPLVTLLVTIVGTFIGWVGVNMATPAICRWMDITGGACNGVKEARFANQCVSGDGKTLMYTVKKPNGTWTTLSASISDGKITQITQLSLVEPTDKEKKQAKEKIKNNQDSGENTELVIKGLPIIYTVKDGDLDKVEVPGRTIREKDLPPKADGEPNDEWFAYSQMKGFVKAMLNFCRDHKDKPGDWDDVIIPLAMKIDENVQKSGATAKSNVAAPGKDTPEIRTLTEVKKEEAAQKRDAAK